MINEINKMPKVELHLHLDGSIPLDIASKLSDLPISELKEKMVVSNDCASLTEYLTKFDFPIQLLQTKENLKLVAEALINTLVRQNVIYAEIRFAPMFHTKKGLSYTDVVEAILEGLNTNTNIKTNLILCMMRGMTEEDNLKTIETAYTFLNKGVCAIDLAGDESKYPTSNYNHLFEIANQKEIPFTIHAGETRNALEVKEAIELGATRIGHGIHAVDDENVIKLIKEKDVLLEICPTSNIQTNVVNDYGKHPIYELFSKDVKVCINTDNTTVSNISITDEYIKLANTFNFTLENFYKMNRYALDHAFISDEEKALLINKLQNY